MESTEKRKWKKQLEQFEVEEGMNMSSAGNQNEGTSNSKQKHKPSTSATAEITPQTIQFERLSGIDSRKWWPRNPWWSCSKSKHQKGTGGMGNSDAFFCIRDYKGFLHAMIETYGRASRRSSFEYLDKDLVVSFKATDFTQVFGIPRP